MTIIIDTTDAAWDYDYLKTQVIDWSHRADLAARMPGFIELAERELFRELALRSVETSESGTTSGEVLALPDNCNAISRVEIEASGNRYTLNYSSPNGVEALTGSVNQPSRFLIENAQIRLIPAPDGPYDYTIFYSPELAPLTDTNSGNWLLANHADLYLKASLLQVAKFCQKDADVMRLTQEVGAALDSVKRADERKRFPVSGGMQIKPRSFR